MTQAMTGRQRIWAAFRHQPTDRIPTFEQSIANSVASKLLGRPALTGTTALHREQAEAALRGPAAYAEFLDQTLDDVVATARLLGHSAVTVPWLLPGAPTRKLDEFTYLYGEEGQGRWTVRRFDPVSQTFGVLRSGGAPQSQEDIEREVQRLEESLNAPPPTEESYPLQRKLMARVGDELEVPGSAYLAIPLEQAWLEMTALRPDLIARYLAAAAEQQCRSIAAQAALGIRILWAGGDLADNSGPVYGPRVFREIVLPRLQKVTACCKRLGVYYLFRTDGKLWSIADDFFEASGIDGYGEIDVDAGMDLVEVRRRYLRITLWGGLSCGRLLRLGTPEQVRAETRRVIDGVGRRGLIFGSSNSILHGTPPENVWAMIEEAAR